MSPYLILFPFWGSCITPQTGLAMWCWREHLCENQEGIYGGVKHCSRIPLGISIPLSSGLGDGRLMLCQDGWFFKTNITISSETLIKGSQTGGRSLTRAEVYVMRHVCLGTSVVSDSVLPMNCSLPGSSAHEILQARILESVANSFSRESYWPRDWTNEQGATSSVSYGSLSPKAPIDLRQISFLT